MTQPRSERSAPPAPQARASAPLRVTMAWASGRSRALPHKRRSITATKDDGPLDQRGDTGSIPPPGTPRIGSRNGRNTSRQIFCSAEIVIVQSSLNSAHGGAPGWVNLGALQLFSALCSNDFFPLVGPASDERKHPVFELPFRWSVPQSVRKFITFTLLHKSPRLSSRRRSATPNIAK